MTCSRQHLWCKNQDMVRDHGVGSWKEQSDRVECELVPNPSPSKTKQMAIGEGWEARRGGVKKLCQRIFHFSPC
jgi:hypothetical protein